MKTCCILFVVILFYVAVEGKSLLENLVKRSPDGCWHTDGNFYEQGPFYDGCNNCYCNENGLTLCTDMVCDKLKKRESPVQCLHSDGNVYSEGSFYDGCNYCDCYASGMVACRKMACIDLHDISNYPEAPCEIADLSSEPYFDGCNWCRCIGNGISCSKKSCEHLSCQASDGTIVEHDESYEESCDTCKCEDGEWSVCTYTC